MAPGTRNRHVSFSAHADTSDLDISIIYFHPEEILSPLSGIASSGLPASSWSADNGQDGHPAVLSSGPYHASSSVRIVDVTLNSPVVLTPLPSDCRKSVSAEFTEVEPIEKPRPLYIRPRQSDRRPDLPPLAIPSAPGLGFTKVQPPAQAKLIDLVEPRTRFTQMLGPNIVFESPSAKAYASSLHSDLNEYSYFSPVHRSNPAKNALRTLTSTTTSLRDWLVRVCKHRTNKQHIEWEMLDEEAMIENKAHRGRVDELLKEIDEQVEERGGIPFVRPEVVEQGPPDLAMPESPYSGAVPMGGKWRQRDRGAGHRNLAKGKCGCGALDEEYCLTGCRMIRAAWRRKAAERREVRRKKWLHRRQSAADAGKEMLMLFLAWPAELVAWIGEHRSLSWVLVAMVVALLTLGMVMSIGRLVEG